MSENGLIVQGDYAPITAKQYQQRVNLIQEVMQQVMKRDTHYGVIPGCQKPSLYKPGAEVLGVTFGLASKLPQVQIKDLPNGHREAVVTIAIEDRSGRIIAEGVGSCSTLESKYRYRKGEGENTGAMVPKEYWEARKANNLDKMQTLLGGKGFHTKKVDGTWFIFKAGEGKSENPDPADQYNTVLKMAKKRAFVDAMLTATGASDIFTQDVEDFGPQAEQPEPPQDSSKHPTPFQNKPEDEDQRPDIEKASAGTQFAYTLLKLNTGQRKAAQHLLEENGASFDPDDGCWYCARRLTNLENCLVLPGAA